MRIATFFSYLVTGLCFYITLFHYPALHAQPQSNFLDPGKPASKYIIEHWSTDEGLPVNTLVNLLQSRDGYMWISSYNGLCRFDGLNFKIFNKENVPAFQTNSVSRLLQTSDGSLLIGTEGGGMLRYENDVFETVIHKEKIGSIQTLWEDDKKQVWIGTHGQGVYTYKKGKLQLFKGMEALNQASVLHISQDRSGMLWFCTEGLGLIGYKNEKFVEYTRANGLHDNKVHTICQDRKDNAIWIGTPSGLFRLYNGKIEVIPQLEGYPVRRIVQDQAGSIWLATQRGLVRRNALSGQYEFLDATNSALPHSDLRDLCVDGEQNLWISSYRSGLIQVKNGKFTNYTQTDGLSSLVANTICEYAPGKYLVGTDAGKIDMIEQGNVSSFPLKTMLSNDKRIKHLMKDREGNLWVSTYDGLIVISPQGKEKHYTIKEGLVTNQVRLVYQASDGVIWIGTRSGGMLKLLEDGKFQVYDKNNGLSSNFIMSIDEDQAGNLLIGTNDGGLDILSKDGKITHYTTKEGMISNLIFNVYIDKAGTRWLATNNGLSRFRDGKFVHYTTRHGLQDESIFDMLEDDFGNVWLTSSKGLIKLTKADLENFAAGKVTTLNCTLYDKHDGMSHSECTGATAALKASNGTLWFPSLGGIVMADPGRMPINRIAPPVYIESFIVDNQPFNLDSQLLISPGAQRFVMEYTAPSFTSPAKTHFKCRLEGFDNKWLDVGTDRRAIYTNLSPGKYTFRIMACNNDGVWNKEGASITFNVEPYFYQASWFWILSLFCLGGTLFGIYRWRVYHIQKRNVELESLIEKRTGELKQSHQELLEKNSALEQQQEEILSQQDVIEEKNKKLEEAFNEIQRKNENITGSIQYAKRIQEALLPLHSEIQEVLPESFIFFKPRDLVSGDFYWFANMRKTAMGNQFVLVAADCTGHGVPGAFMSMAGDAYLNQIVKLQGITEPDKILTDLHRHIANALRQNESQNRDGMDIAICTIHTEKRILEFGGAKNPLLYVRDGEVHELKGDKAPIGGQWGEGERVFTKQTIELDKPMEFYMFSDGYADQFGGPDGKKFTKKRLKDLLLQIHDKPATEQERLVAATMKDWMGTTAQLDDILLLGFRVG